MSTAPQPQPTLEQSLRMLRIVHLSFVVAPLLQIALGEMLVRNQANGPRDPIDQTVLTIFTTMGLLEGGAVLVIRSKIIDAAVQIIRQSPSDTLARGRFQLGYFLSFALSESIVLFGFVARFLGAELSQAGILYALGLFLMIFSTPHRP